MLNPIGYGQTSYGYGLNVGSSSPISEGEGKKTGVVRSASDAGDCQTCKERKYVDGSDEMVSFKSPAHISPEASASAVRGHEQEHVNNAYSDAAQKNGKVVSCSVSLKMGVCPECGRSYVAGGTTNTTIKYQNESNPYVKNAKSAHATALKGMNFDAAV